MVFIIITQLVYYVTSAQCSCRYYWLIAAELNQNKCKILIENLIRGRAL